jgi:hypothetical protein
MGNQKVTQAIVVASSAIGPPSQGVERIALYNPDGTPITTAADTGATVVLTGYSAQAKAPVGATDTVNQAIAKLEARINTPTIVALTDAATILVDASLGNHFTVTLAGNRTLGVPSNPVDGQKITFEVAQDATGSRTLAFASSAGGYSFGAVSAPTVTATASAVSLVEFLYSARKAKWLYRTSQLGF